METEIDTVVSLDVEKIRADFPILAREINSQPLAYLDNASSAQRPRVVIDAISDYYENEHSNVHRGVHKLSAEATEKYEHAREKVKAFINAEHAHEIIWTRGTTEAINLVASSFGRQFLKEGDEIILTEMEHHSNIVPWQLICEQRRATLKVMPITDTGELILEELDKLLTDRTKVIALTHVSNTLGTINPVKEIIQEAHKHDVPVLLDGAQAVPHMPVDVQDLDVDFYAFSGHKMFGPTGIGVLYGKEKWLEQMPPYHGGGTQIKTVTFEKTTYEDLPNKFEAGTPHIAGAIGLEAAIDYLHQIGMDSITEYEAELTGYALEKLGEINDLRLIGTAAERTSVFSFLIGEIHSYDTGTILDQLGIAVRTGHHCTEPLMNRFGITGTVRASFVFYNTKAEVDKLVDGIAKVKEMLA